MKLIVGLGNPGKKYERTRHNAGWLALDAFMAAHPDAFGTAKTKFDAEIFEGYVALDNGREKVVLMKPQTFMNESGAAVAPAAKFWKLGPDDIIIAYDDIAIPLGAVRIRADGSAGGHNGMKSVIAHLGAPVVSRIRIGVGTERSKDVPSEDWVLGKFSKEEQEPLGEGIAATVGALHEWLREGLTAAQNKYGK